MGLVVPAILPASKKQFEEQIALLVQSPAVTRIQIDVVDGRIATPASWPYNAPGALRAMRSEGYSFPALGRIEYEMDLMCLDAADASSDWLALGASRLTFHVETVLKDPQFFLKVKKRFGGSELGLAQLVSVGLAIGLDTDLKIIEPYIASIDYLQCMGIARKGRQGQPFDPRAAERIRALRKQYPLLSLQVDGGVTLEHAKELSRAGADAVIVGSAILEAKDPLEAIADFDALGNPFGV